MGTAMQEVLPRHTLIVLVEDKPGVLSQVVNLFRRRNYNIESLTVGHSETAGMSRMTVVVCGDDAVVEQVIKQLYKLIPVTKVTDITDDVAVIRELALVRVHAPASKRGEIKQLAIDQGMLTLRRDGWEKVFKRVTTVEEVLRVTEENE